LKRDTEPEHGKITMLGGGYGEMSEGMKNTECAIYITTKHGWTQSYRKENNGWTQPAQTV
jgi:hypothetical protein